MRMLNLPDGPEQQARDAAFIKSGESSAASNPKLGVPEAAEKETTTSRQLKDFDPPPVVTGTFVPSTRAYLIDYDVYTHVSSGRRPFRRHRNANNIVNLDYGVL